MRWSCLISSKVVHALILSGLLFLPSYRLQAQEFECLADISTGFDQNEDEPVPEGVGPDPQGCDDPHARDDYSSLLRHRGRIETERTAKCHSRDPAELEGHGQDPIDGYTSRPHGPLAHAGFDGDALSAASFSRHA